MCFSPEASFAASAFLFAGSIAGYKKIVSSGLQNRKLFALLLVPLCFAIQQFFEGVLWLSLLNNYSAVVTSVATYSFIFFAFIFWPAYIPSALYCLERGRSSGWRIYALQFLMFVGFVVAAVLLYEIFAYGISASNMSCHIMYTLNSVGPYAVSFSALSMFAYLLATVAPMLVSSVCGMPFVGVLVAIAYEVTARFYSHHLISVWCFFAAVVSISVYWVICKNLKK